MTNLIHITILFKSQWLYSELYNAIEKINFVTLKRFAREFFNSFLTISGLVQGNVNRDQAYSLYFMVKDNLIKKGSRCVVKPNTTGKKEMLLYRAISGTRDNDVIPGCVLISKR